MNNKFDITDTDLHENTERVCNDIEKLEDGRCKHRMYVNKEDKIALCGNNKTHFLCNLTLKLKTGVSYL